VTAPVVPQNADELTSALSEPGTLTALNTPEKLSAWIGEYAQKAVKADSGILAQLKEEREATQSAYVEVFKAAKGEPKRLDLTAKTGKTNKFYNAKAPGRKADALFLGEDGEFDASGYFKAIWSGQTESASLEKRSQLQEIRNTYGSVIPSDGGFLIPETLRSDLLRVALETAVVRRLARTVPMETLRVPFPTIDSTSNASSVYGGVIGYWAEESAALTQSQATFGRIVLQANKLTTYCEAPNELMQDSIVSFAAFINQIFPEAIAWFEDKAFFSGTGAGEPLGFLNATAAVSVAKESGQTAATIVWENIVKMYSRMLPTSLGRAVWIANIDTFPELATMALSVGTGGAPVWMANGQVGPPMTLLGRPVIFTEKCQTLGTVGDLNFVDLNYYLIGDRQVATGAVSDQYKFANDQTAFRFTQRVDGRPWLTTAITPNVSSSTLSAFVKLATRA
jgi:HK97 family phage major capsid protein